MIAHLFSGTDKSDQKSDKKDGRGKSDGKPAGKSASKPDAQTLPHVTPCCPRDPRPSLRAWWETLLSPRGLHFPARLLLPTRSWGTDK